MSACACLLSRADHAALLVMLLQPLSINFSSASAYPGCAPTPGSIDLLPFLSEQLNGEVVADITAGKQAWHLVGIP